MNVDPLRTCPGGYLDMLVYTCVNNSFEIYIALVMMQKSPLDKNFVGLWLQFWPINRLSFSQIVGKFGQNDPFFPEKWHFTTF